MQNFKDLDIRDVRVNPFTMIGNDWMLVTAEKDGKINTMTASWGGMGVMWGRNVVYVVLRPQRYTKEFVDASETFSLSFFNKEYKKTLGYLGSVSGRDEDKLAKSGLTSVMVGQTPAFEEAETILICKKLFTQPYLEESFLNQDVVERWYPEKDFHMMYIAEVERYIVKNS